MRVRRALPHDPRAAGGGIGGEGVEHLRVGIQHHDVRRRHDPVVVRRRTGGERILVARPFVAAQHVSDAGGGGVGRLLVHPGVAPGLPLLVQAHRVFHRGTAELHRRVREADPFVLALAQLPGLTALLLRPIHDRRLARDLGRPGAHRARDLLAVAHLRARRLGLGALVGHGVLGDSERGRQRKNDRQRKSASIHARTSA